MLAWHSYASTVLGALILSLRPSVTRMLCDESKEPTGDIFYTTWKGNPSSQVWFFVQLCSSWQDFNGLKASLGLSAIAELLVKILPLQDWAVNLYWSHRERLHHSDNTSLRCILKSLANRWLTVINGVASCIVLREKSHVDCCLCDRYQDEGHLGSLRSPLRSETERTGRCRGLRNREQMRSFSPERRRKGASQAAADDRGHVWRIDRFVCLTVDYK